MPETQAKGENMSETKETHVHVREDGTVIEHSHGPHGHHHSHEQTKAVRTDYPEQSDIWSPSSGW